METPREIHWGMLHGNALLRSLHPQMIQGKYLELRLAVLKGQATKHGTAIKEQVKVAYDRSFAIAKLSMVLLPLKALSREVVEQLLTDVLNFIYSDENHSHSDSNMGEDSNEG